jgi:LPS sulfotransferase NodH
VHIERLDRLGQAISWGIAEQTGQWRSGGTPAAEPAYNPAGIEAAMARFAEDNRRFDDFFGRNGLVPQHVTYEALVQTPEAVAAAAVAGLFDATPRFDLSQVMFARQAGARNAAWRARFLAERG